MSQISVDRLTKAWESFKAVDNVSFTAESAEFIALLGPSGCGKSTTLRLIAGLDTISDGRIVINGQDVSRQPASRRNLSMVFQSYALFPHLNAADNITFGLSVRGVPAAERKKRLMHVAELLDLNHLMARKPGQMSGGQQQRVALGRALIAETPVCLLDEPLSNLDAKLRAGMRSEIRALQKRLGITMVYVTHDQTEAMSMSDKVILLNKGRIEQSGAPAELYERPASVFVAQFIGTPPMNILETEIRPSGLTIRGASRPVAPASAGDVLMGIRPEHVRFDDAGEPAIVEATEYFGADTILACRIGGQTLLVRSPGRPNVMPGAAVRFGWNANEMHFFDKSSGQRRDDIKAL